jgi:hypothetical protein
MGYHVLGPWHFEIRVCVPVRDTVINETVNGETERHVYTNN